MGGERKIVSKPVNDLQESVLSLMMVRCKSSMERDYVSPESRPDRSIKYSFTLLDLCNKDGNPKLHPTATDIAKFSSSFHKKGSSSSLCSSSRPLVNVSSRSRLGCATGARDIPPSRGEGRRRPDPIS